LRDFPKMPQAGEAGFYLAECFWRLGEQENAVAAMRKFLQDHPESRFLSAACAKLAEWLIELGRPGELRAVLSPYLKHRDQELVQLVRFWLAEAAAQEERLDYALEAFSRLVEEYGVKSRYGAWALFRKGEILLYKQDLLGAQKAFYAVLKAAAEPELVELAKKRLREITENYYLEKDD